MSDNLQQLSAEGSKSDADSEPRLDEYQEPEPVLSSESAEGTSSSSSTASSDTEPEEALGFPAHALQKLNDGLNRGSWVVYIACLIDCERAAASLIKHPDRGSMRDLELARKLMRGTLNEAFDKVLADPAVNGWVDSVQLQTFTAVLALLDLTSAKLSQFNPQGVQDPAQALEDEIDLVNLLESMQHAVDTTCTFNLKNQDCILPPKLPRTVIERFASPHMPELPNITAGDVDHCQQYPTFTWPAYFINYFGYRRGYQHMRQALAYPKRMSLELLKHILLVLNKCLYLATDHFVQNFQQDFEDVLVYLDDTIEQDVEQLSENGSDRMFLHLSVVFTTLYQLLSYCKTPPEAEEMVTGVQCRFSLQMLSYGNFNKHLSAVREIFYILRRAQELSRSDRGQVMQRINAWLQRHNVVAQLLRSNLHQRQYVDQVQRVLKVLVVEQSLQQEHVALLWDLTEKPDTFEAVKINVFNMLVELAQTFNEEQLDFLFKKFESSAARSNSENKQGMLLLFRLAKFDQQGVMTKRILGLLWRIALVPSTPTGLDMAAYFADVLRDYAIMSNSQDTRSLALDYVSQLVHELNGTEKAVPSMRVLSHLIAPMNAHTDVFLHVLEQDGNILETVLHSLQNFMTKSRETLRTKHRSAWLNFHDDAVRCYSSFLLDLVERMHVQMSWEFIQGLWSTLVEQAIVPGDRNAAFSWFTSVMQESGTPSLWQLISRENSELLLMEKIAKLDPTLMSRTAYDCFAAYFKELASQKMTDSHPNLELNLPGMDFLWNIVLDTPCSDHDATPNNQALILTAQDMLISLYNRSDPADQVSKPHCADFVRICVENLQAAAEQMSGKAGLQSLMPTEATSMHVEGISQSQEHLSAQRAARCMQLLLEMNIKCRGRTMPSKPAHAASHTGRPMAVHVTHPNLAVKQSICMSSNSYVGQLRREVSANRAFNSPPEKLRMFIGGKELLSDAVLLHEAGLNAEQCVVNVMPMTNPNTFTSPEPTALQALEAASPTLLLSSQHSNIFPVLLWLTDFNSSPTVRAAAKQLLDILPTYDQVSKDLRAALQGSAAAVDMQRLLCVQQADELVPGLPGRLLYTLQALSSLLNPQHGKQDTEESTAASHEPNQPAQPDPRGLQEVVLQPQVIDELLNAVQSASDASNPDVHTIRTLYITAHELASGLAQRLQEQRCSLHTSSPAVSMQRPASAISTSPMSIQTAVPANADVSMTPMSAHAAHPDEGTSAQSGSQLVEEEQQEHTEAPAPQSAVAGQHAGSAGTPSVSGDLSSNVALTDAATIDLISLKLLHFFLHEGLQAAKGWGAITTPMPLVHDAPNELPEMDVGLVQSVYDIILQMLHQSNVLLPSFLQLAGSRELIEVGLLCHHHEGVRQLTGRFLLSLALKSAAAAHLWVMQLFMAHIPHADRKPHFCGCFYDVFAEVVKHMSRQPPEVHDAEIPAARSLLGSLVQLLPDLSAVDEHDLRMHGKLELGLQLILVLGSQALASNDCQQLVTLLMTVYLFPEAYLQFKYDTLPEVPPNVLRAALLPRCNTKPNRDVTLRLLRVLVLHDTANLHTGLRLIKQLHLTRSGPNFDHLPHHTIRSMDSFVGMKNGGATCYMNAILQQLFMQPSIRKLLLAVPDIGSAADNADNVFYQMQTMFANLALSNKEFYVPRAFWNAFKDYDGTRLNLREHQDAYEFFTRLQDTADQYLRDRRLPPVLQAVIGGKFAQQIICRGVPYRSEKEEDFYQVSLDVRDKRTLEESLDLYVQGELMEGDNQYLCEEAGQKVDAVKRSCIKALPHTLVIHLKRFEFDYETMTRWKIKDRFEFPEQLDMYKYTVEGLAEAEQAEAAPSHDPEAASPSPSPSPPQSPPKTKQQYQYKLKGIVVHSGSAFAGHYYSFIKVRSADGFAGSADHWYCFDDVNVEPWDFSNLDKDCFGGKYTLDMQHYKGTPQEFDRPNSAYMLFYERAESLEPVATSQALGALFPTPAQPLSGDSSDPAHTHQQAAVQQHQQTPAEVDVDEPMLPPSPQPMQSPPASAETSPNVLAQLANVSPLKEVSSVNLGQDTEQHPPGIASAQSGIIADLQLCSTVALPCEMPRPSYVAVLTDNLQLLKTSHLLDPAYFTFIMAVVKASSEMCSHKFRRTGAIDAAGQGGGAIGAGSRPVGASRKAEDPTSMAVLAMDVALGFLFKIYVRTTLSMRESLAEWRSVLQNIMESSATATQMLLYTLATTDMQLLEDTLICAQEDVREFTAGLILDALKCAVSLHGGAHDPELGEAEDQDMADAVDHMLTTLRNTGLQAVQDEKVVEHAVFTQLMQLLKEYALMGSQQRQHLVALMALPELIAQVVEAVSYQSNSEYSVLDFQPPLSLLGILFRRADLDKLNGKQTRANPHRFAEDVGFSPHITEAATELTLSTMCRPEVLLDPHVIKGLQFLMWENKEMTLEILRFVHMAWRKYDPIALYQAAPAYAEMMTIEDTYAVPRLEYLMFRHIENSSDVLGILYVVQLRTLRHPWRRCAAYRLAYCLCKQDPTLLAKFVQHVPDVMSSQAISMNYSSVVPDARSNKRVCDEVKDLLNSLKHGIDQCAEADIGP